MIEIRETLQFSEWLIKLKDREARMRIQSRILRLSLGNPGQHRVLKAGVCEMKVDFGPGYRVYYTQHGTLLVILLCGGDKSTQSKDIKIAEALAKGV